ncbi:hypothetical protein Gpo141_00001524 [Globisporangium polare]
MHAPSAIAHMYTYTRDVLLSVVETLMKLLHLDALLPMPIDQSASAGEKEEPERWTMTVEPYVPPSSRRPSTSQPEQELPVAHEVHDEKRDEQRDAGIPDTKPSQLDKLGDVVPTEYPDYTHLPVIHEVHDKSPTTTPSQDEKRITSDANAINPAHVGKVGDVIAIVHREHDHTSLITSPHLKHVLPDKDVTEETPEVCESKLSHLERTQSSHDVLADADEPTNFDEPTRTLSDAPSSLKLANAELSEDLDRVSNESNATDDTEADRMRSLDRVYPMEDEHDAKRRRLEDTSELLKDTNVPTPTSSRGDYKLSPPSSTSSRGGRSGAAVAKSKSLEWPASSSSEDDEEFTLEERFTSPRFMPTMGQATYFSTGM